MLLTTDMPDAFEYEIRDAMGSALGGVMAYDTQTQEVDMVLCDIKGQIVWYADGVNHKPIIIKTFIPGSVAINKKTGKKVS